MSVTARRTATALLVAAVVLTAALASVIGPVSAVPPGRTRISITVVGCDGCRVQPVQNKDGTASYFGNKRTVRGDPVTLTFAVPTQRTKQMAFLVWAPSDEFNQGFIPGVAVLGYTGKEPGSSVSDGYAATTRPVSGCWAGTRQAQISRTLVVTTYQAADPLLGPGRHSLAASHFTRTLPSLPYYRTVRRNGLHASDPSICK